MKESRFKETEIGKIPLDWEICLVGDTFKRLSSNTLSRDCLNHKDGTIKNIHYGDILTKFGEYIDVNKDEVPYINPDISIVVSSTNKLQDNDVIFADTAEDEVVGKATQLVNVNDTTVVSGLHTIVLRPNFAAFAPKYLGYFFNSSTYHNQLFPYMQGIKVLSVSKKALDSTYLIYPKEVTEQNEIAETLSNIDSLIYQLCNLIEKKKAIKQGAMQELLTGKRRLNGFTDPWCEVPFEKIYEYAKEGGTPNTTVDEYYNPGIIPFAKIEDLKQKYLFAVSSYISEEGLANSSAWLIPSDSIILSNGATIGEVCINKIDVSTKQGILGIVLKENFSSEFIYYYFKHNIFKKELEKVTTHGTMDCAYLKDINSINLVIPQTIKEQNAIASILKNIDEEIILLDNKRTKYTAIKQGMMQQLLSGKIRLT